MTLQEFTELFKLDFEYSIFCNTTIHIALAITNSATSSIVHSDSGYCTMFALRFHCNNRSGSAFFLRGEFQLNTQVQTSFYFLRHEDAVIFSFRSGGFSFLRLHQAYRQGTLFL